SVATNIFLPSLTGMAEHFETDFAVIQLMLSLFLGATAVFQLVVGPLSDYFGRRPVLLWSFIIFCVSSLVCVHAPNVEILLVARFFQASAAAGVVLSRAIIRDIVSTDRSASMMGYVTMAYGIAPT